MPALRLLLACPHGEVVTDVILMLTFCRCVFWRDACVARVTFPRFVSMWCAFPAFPS
jgi:hypothetical protein